MKTLYVFGNPYLKEDNFAVEVAKNLDKVKIEYCDSPEALMFAGEEELLILDVVKGVKEIIVLEDVDKIKSRKLISLHDFDLGFFLKLLKELGQSKRFKIIGIPDKGDSFEIAKKVGGILDGI